MKKQPPKLITKYKRALSFLLRIIILCVFLVPILLIVHNPIFLPEYIRYVISHISEVQFFSSIFDWFRENTATLISLILIGIIWEVIFKYDAVYIDDKAFVAVKELIKQSSWQSKLDFAWSIFSKEPEFQKYGDNSKRFLNFRCAEKINTLNFHITYSKKHIEIRQSYALDIESMSEQIQFIVSNDSIFITNYVPTQNVMAVLYENVEFSNLAKNIPALLKFIRDRVQINGQNNQNFKVKRLNFLNAEKTAFLCAIICEPVKTIQITRKHQLQYDDPYYFWCSDRPLFVREINFTETGAGYRSVTHCFISDSRFESVNESLLKFKQSNIQYSDWIFPNQPIIIMWKKG